MRTTYGFVTASCVVCACLAAAVLASGAAAAGDAVFRKEFSAEVVESGQGGRKARSRLRVGHNHLSHDAGDTVAITDFSRKVFYMVHKPSRSYVQHEGERAAEMVSPPAYGKAACIRDKASVCTRIGPATVSGRRTEKWKIESKRSWGTKVVFQYLDSELGMPIKEEEPGGAVREFENIVIAPQPARLFEVPSGFTRQVPGRPGGR